MGLIYLVPAAGVFALIFAILLIRDILRRDTGTPEMQQIGDMIMEGALAFLRRQYTTIGIIALFTAVIVGALVGTLDGEVGLEEGGIDALGIAWRTGLAFLVGAFCSAVSGYIGMYISVKSNVRCAAAARQSLNGAITVALRGGAVSGFLIVALSLIGVAIMYYAYGGHNNPNIAPHTIVGFGFGASFVALFAQLGGGIYTKAADMGADLVGKVEAGIPEDDPRNAAVIADLVGDNVGDCAGRGADLFESTAAENIGAMILGIVLWRASDAVGLAHPEVWVLFPLVVRSFGIFASMLGVMSVKAKEDENPMNALNRGYFLAVGLSLVGMVVTVFVMLGSDYVWLIGSGAIGILASVAVVFITIYYTEPGHKPVDGIAEASKTGPATNIVSGTAVGFETTVATGAAIGFALLLAYWMGDNAIEHAINAGIIPGMVGGLAIHGGVFGTAVATMGMLMTCPFILTMDTFGPITDNANGVIEMAGVGGEARSITDRLDAVGNTTKALTKGFAMVSAGLAAFLLFQAYLERVALLREVALFEDVNLARVEVFVGALAAVMLVFLFSSMAIKAVGKTAGMIIEEVRRQFRADPGIMEGTSRPDYARAVDITARAGLRSMIAPSLLVVGTPVILGVIFNQIESYDAAMAVAAFLMVGTIAGILLASFLNNSGGAWDNAKKKIEAGELLDREGNVLGKGTDAHAAAVVGDTVGDPFKDTAGPSLHVLVKLLSTITLVLCPLWVV
ncbi:MAG: sodium-translocating pyrophosphatase [Dehalococcoidia bacterium]|nr:MAG: sodium-translocating pyrophosphatase [Dehalococcoidia bacterium]